MRDDVSGGDEMQAQNNKAAELAWAAAPAEVMEAKRRRESFILILIVAEILRLRPIVAKGHAQPIKTTTKSGGSCVLLLYVIQIDLLR